MKNKQMKLSQLKHIIRESIRELKTKKGLLTENCVAYSFTEPVQCWCSSADRYIYDCEGTNTVTRYTNCNMTHSHDCGCCTGMTDPKRGEDRAPEELGL